jgi:hypothetical protein
LKPLHLNLAARPYRDYRPFTLVMAAGWLVFFILAYVNVDTYLRYKTATRQTASAIERLDHQTDEERRRTEDAEARIKTIDILVLAKKTEFANAQLAERAFSWSELLDRLERVLPNDVRIEGVAPVFDKGGLVHLKLEAHGKTTDSMVRTLASFNADAHFADAFPTVEELTPTGDYKFNLSVDYRPTIARVVE